MKLPDQCGIVAALKGNQIIALIRRNITEIANYISIKQYRCLKQ